MNFQQKVIEVTKERFPLPVSDIYGIHLDVQFAEHEYRYLTSCVLDADFPTRNFTFIMHIDPNFDKYDDISYRDKYIDAIAFMQTYDINVNKHALFVYELLLNMSLIEICTILIQHGKGSRIDSVVNASSQVLFTSTEKKEFSDKYNSSLIDMFNYTNNRKKVFAMQNFKRVWDQVKKYIPEGDK